MYHVPFYFVKWGVVHSAGIMVRILVKIMLKINSKDYTFSAIGCTSYRHFFIIFIFLD